MGFFFACLFYMALALIPTFVVWFLHNSILILALKPMFGWGHIDFMPVWGFFTIVVALVDNRKELMFWKKKGSNADSNDTP